MKEENKTRRWDAVLVLCAAASALALAYCTALPCLPVRLGACAELLVYALAAACFLRWYQRRVNSGTGLGRRALTAGGLAAAFTGLVFFYNNLLHYLDYNFVSPGFALFSGGQTVPYSWFLERDLCYGKGWWRYPLAFCLVAAGCAGISWLRTARVKRAMRRIEALQAVLETIPAVDTDIVNSIDLDDALFEEKLLAALDHLPRNEAGLAELKELVEWMCREEPWDVLFHEFFHLLDEDEQALYIEKAVPAVGRDTLEDWLAEIQDPAYESGRNAPLDWYEVESLYEFGSTPEEKQRMICFWEWCYRMFSRWRTNQDVWKYLFTKGYADMTPEMRRRFEPEARERFGDDAVDEWIGLPQEDQGGQHGIFF